MFGLCIMTRLVSRFDDEGSGNVYPTIVKNGQPVLLTDWSELAK